MESFSLVQFFATIAPLPILVSVIIGFWKFKHSESAEKHVIVLIVAAFVTQVVATILWWKMMNNLFLSHYFTIIEGYLLLRYFSYYLNGKERKLIQVLTIGFLIFSISQLIMSYPNFGVNAVSKGVESVLLIAVSLVLWRKIMRDYTEDNLLSKPLFWINSATLIYFSASTLLFIFSESLLSREHSVGLSLWGMHLSFMTIYYTLISLGLWKITRK